MYVSIQTVCRCHGYLQFESIQCDRCRSLIPFQISDESLVEPISHNNATNGTNMKSIQSSKHVSEALVQYQKHHRHQSKTTTGRVRFRASCPFCNSPTYVLRYYCRRERIYYHLRIQNFGDSEQSVYRSISESQQMYNHGQDYSKHSRKKSFVAESADDSYSLSESTHYRPPSTILYDQSGIANAKDIQIENEKNLYALNGLEGDLFNILRNGLFYDTIIQCQDNVRLQVHRCILGGRSPWFRQLLSEYHDSESQDDYVLQISIDDVQSEVMNELLNFMYTNRCLISLKNAPELLVAAKRFEIEKLRKQVADFLLTRLTVENAIDLFIGAHESGAEVLKIACIRLINRHAETIKRTEKWRKFKADHVDLVPELYESRVERLAPVPNAFLPDVFSGPMVPSESLQRLSRLYENPAKQRLASPTVRILPASTKPSRSRSPTPVVELHQLRQPQTPVIAMRAPRQPNEAVTIEPSGSFIHPADRTLPSGVDQATPMKKPIVSKTKRQPAPAPAAPPLMRTFYSTVKQNSEVDDYRRPVNLREKSVTLPTTTTQKQQPTNTNAHQKPPPPPTVHQKAPPPTQQKSHPTPAPPKPPPPTQQKPPPPPQVYKPIPPPPPPQHKSPSLILPRTPSPVVEKMPPSLAPVKVSRGVSPRYVIEIRETPTLSDVGTEDHMLEREVSTETME